MIQNGYMLNEGQRTELIKLLCVCSNIVNSSARDNTLSTLIRSRDVLEGLFPLTSMDLFNYIEVIVNICIEYDDCLETFVEIVIERERKSHAGMELEDWYKKTIARHSQKIEISIVVAAMTRDEATELPNYFSTKGIEPPRFLLQPFIGQGATDQLVERYGITRDDWCPRLGDTRSIREIVEETVKELNIQSPQGINLELHFESTDFFSFKYRTTRRLADHPFLLIIDPISIFHPTFNNIIDALNDGDFSMAAIIIIKNSNADIDNFYTNIDEDLARQLKIHRYRSVDIKDTLYESEITDLRIFRRRLAAQIDRTSQLLSRDYPHPRNASIIQPLMSDKPGNITMKSLVRRGGL